MKKLLLLLLSLSSVVSFAQGAIFANKSADQDHGSKKTKVIEHRPYLLPLPQRIEWEDSFLTVRRIEVQTPVLRQTIEGVLSELGLEIDSNAPAQLVVSIVDTLHEVRLNSEEAYTLRIDKQMIQIEAQEEKGVFNALQTLRQLATRNKKSTTFPTCRITDWPAFRIRGWMHDVGRSYISIEELKTEIKMLARFKVNVFHWHLTENQAWRLESKVFPMLNDSCNMTRHKGKFYTLEQAKDLVDFCKRHNVLLIPEIDMPGHSEAFERTFRHSMQSVEGMEILKQLIEEICQTFDVPYLHIGTDEVRFTNPNFVPEMVAYIRSQGKKVISWNPGWKYKAGEIDLTQLWSYRGKAQKGIPAIDSRFHYLNHYDTFADLVSLYFSRIYNQAEGSDDVAGVILGIWNDRKLEDERNIVLENGLYPHTLTMAERAWRGGGNEYFDKRGTVLPEEGSKDFREFEEFEQRLLWHKEHTLNGLPFGYVRQTNVRWNITDAFPNDGDLDRKFPPEDELKESYTYQGKTYNVRKAIGAGIYLRHVWGSIVPAFYENPQENHTAYAYTWVYSPKAQEVGLLVEFQNYGRSEKDLAPLPHKWDYKGSRLWINQKEIMPPKWTATHRIKSNEINLGNENAVARPPIKVSLNKGWNKVLLKLPIGKFRTEEIRLMKWMFTCVFVTPDGRKEMEGLIYAPNKTKR